MKNILKFLVIILILSNSLFAKNINSNKFYYGWILGFQSEMGIKFRYWFKNKNGIETSLMPIINNNSQDQLSNFDIYINYDIQGLRLLNNTKYTDLYFYYGAGIEYEQYRHNGFLEFLSGSDYSLNINMKHKINYSINSGFGVSFNLNPIVFNFSTGFASIYRYYKKDIYIYPILSFSILVSTFFRNDK